MRRFLRGLRLALVWLVVFVVMLEVTMQIYTRFVIIYDVEMSQYAVRLKQRSDNPKIGHVHRPNTSATLMGVDVQINSDGLRDREYDVARGDSARIVVLGDSITFGWGVEEADTFVSLLEQEIGRSTPVEMINFGIGNFNTEQQVSLFLEKGLKYSPDGVLVFWFINDAETTPQRSNWMGLSHSRAVSFVWSRARSVLARLSSSNSFQDYYGALYEPDQPGWQAMTKAFRELRDVCRENGIALGVVLVPELHDLVDYPFLEEYARIGEFLSREGIAYKDLVPDFLGTRNSHELWVARDDAHPNSAGHKMIADHSRTFVEQEIMGR